MESDDPPQLGGYRLLARLGAGGMGRVYLARSRGGRRVALKVIRPELADDQDFRARFAREVSSARVVGGAFTVAVLDADAEAATPWLATEFVAGPALSTAVRDHGPLPVESVRALAAGLAEALAAIHGAGVIHRDLKPSNVLLAADGPRVIDFGISRAVEATELTRTGMIVGSPGFMSPEQIEGLPVTPAADVFSLGAVLAYAATGAGPFGEGATPALLYRVVHSEPRLDEVPAELRSLVADCLAKDPARRPSPDALLDRLEETTTHEPTQTWLPAELTGMIARVEAELPSRLGSLAGKTEAAGTAGTQAAAAGAGADGAALAGAAGERATPPTMPQGGVPVQPTLPVGFGPAPAGFGPAQVAGFAAEGPPTPPLTASTATRESAGLPPRRSRRTAAVVVAVAAALALSAAGVVIANGRNPGSASAGGNPTVSTSAQPSASTSSATTSPSAATSAAGSSGPPPTASANQGAGTVYYTVPTVTGQSVSYATQLLVTAGFSRSAIKVAYHCSAAGSGVYAQSPDAGSRQPSTATIKLSASPDNCVAYPNEVGQPLATAKTDLKGFSNVSVRYVCAGGTVGNVVDQSPAATAEASYPSDQPITLTVQQTACGSPSTTPAPSSTYPTQSPAPGTT
ncbi:protein kinase [Streptacidiphilus sp. MAP12-16]|uniref:serine/threonine-protein kinase n=1 Tax=Streptacidiphilus sp. MAP12-16 TaxID=3156300 RepID=UPI003517D48F